VVEPPADAARILIVDDDDDLRRALCLALEDEGYDVLAFGDGQAALAALESWRPHVILLDLMMPGLDGWDFRACQLATPGLEDVPVIVLSAARDVRVDAIRPARVLPKPFNLGNLLDNLAEVLR
jgi:DNA-binding response OmpR family regulator